MKKTTKKSTSKKEPTGEFEASILRGLKEAVAHSKGELSGLRVTERRLTAKTATAKRAPKYKPADIKKLRSSLHLSQPVLAEALNVKVETLRAWEQGVKSPSGPALRLLQWAQQNPDLVLSQIQTR